MRKILALAFAVVALAAAGGAHAISDGHYSFAKMHCSGSADNNEKSHIAEPGCYTVIATVADRSGHEYVGVGIRQTADGDFPHVTDVWVDPGQPGPHDKLTWTLDDDGPHGPVASAGTEGDPSTGVQVYFGGDDNLDVGEHDSSEQINNGPSDGGGIQVNVDPATIDAWVAALQGVNVAYLLGHPAPLVNGGTGACADGICFSAASQREVAFQGFGDGSRDVADYEGKKWDPESCDGSNDTPGRCDDPDVAGQQDITYWAGLEGTVYVEPGFQLYEDPDPQASPIGPYPLPALYVGSCGVILGGPGMEFPPSPFTNTASQLEIRTADCASA